LDHFKFTGNAQSPRTSEKLEKGFMKKGFTFFASLQCEPELQNFQKFRIAISLSTSKGSFGSFRKNAKACFFLLLTMLPLGNTAPIAA
jgi:hypothetical protein